MSISNRQGRSSNSAPAPARSPTRLIERGVDQKRLVLVEYNPGFCALLRDPLSAMPTVVQGDAYTSARLAAEYAQRACFPPLGVRPAAR